MIIIKYPKMLEEPRYLSDYVFNHSFQIETEDLTISFIKLFSSFKVFISMCGGSAQLDYVDGEFRRQISVLDDAVFEHYFVQILLEVLGTVQQQVKHVLQLPGREDGREPRS